MDKVDSYISAFPRDIQAKLIQMLAIIREAAPGAEEVVSYGMPAFRQNGILVYFAAHKNHIGFYPTASAIEKFAPELTAFKTSKGAVQFPFDRELPSELIKRMVRFRVSENDDKKKKK